MVSNGNQMWNVVVMRPSKVNAGTKVQVTGTMTANNLQSGLIVELTADIDNRNTIQGKVNALTITSITREKPMGVFPDADSGFGGNDSDKSAKRPTHAKSGKAGRGQIVGRCRIVGQLIARGGSLSVKYGRGTLSFQLGETPKINVDMADLSLARPGQEVSIKGYASPRQPNMVQATEVKIKLPDVPDADKPEKADKKEAAKPEAKRRKKVPKRTRTKGCPNRATASNRPTANRRLRLCVARASCPCFLATGKMPALRRSKMNVNSTSRVEKGNRRAYRVLPRVQ